MKIIEKILYNQKLMKCLEIISWIVFMILLITACSTIKYVPVKEGVLTKVEIKDSIRIKDSIVVIPIERVVDVVSVYDTLCLETDLARALTYVDTTNHILRGTLENKSGIQYRTLIKERVIEKCDTIKVYQEISIPVEKEVKVIPKSYWFLLVSFILTIAYIAFRLFI